MNIEQLKKSLKRTKLVNNILIAVALGCMLADILTTGNLFVHVQYFMIISLVSFGLAILLDRYIKFIRCKIKEAEQCCHKA